MYDGLGVIGFLAAILALGATTKHRGQIKTLRDELDATRTELKLPPIDRDRRDAKGWKIQ